MRFRKGSIVEVLSTNEMSSGSWYRAEIIHGDGHYYTVRYEGVVGGPREEALFGRIPRKAIRPCPPPMQNLENLESGVVVEVFHQSSWKMATVLSALTGTLLLVKLFGSEDELEVSKHDVRAGLNWHDDQWKIIAKASDIYERQDPPSTLKYNHSSQQTGARPSIVFKASYFPSSNFNSIHNSQDIPSKSLKRKVSCCCSQNEEYAIPGKKVRKESRCSPFISSHHKPLPEELFSAASLQKILVEKRIPPSNGRLIGYSGTNMEQEKIGVVRCSLDYEDTGSITSSVASCSASQNNALEISQRYHREASDNNSDAESICQLGLEEGNCPLPSLPADEKLAQEVHRLELHAYRSIMEALYVAGPLSWEQETLLTDLRDSLHISNDEHLMELRNLISSRTSIPNS